MSPPKPEGKHVLTSLKTQHQVKALSLSLAGASINIVLLVIKREVSKAPSRVAGREGGDLGLTGGLETSWLTLSSEPACCVRALVGSPLTVWTRESALPDVAGEPFQTWQYEVTSAKPSGGLHVFFTGFLNHGAGQGRGR